MKFTLNTSVSIRIRSVAIKIHNNVTKRPISIGTPLHFRTIAIQLLHCYSTHIYENANDYILTIEIWYRWPLATNTMVHFQFAYLFHFSWPDMLHSRATERSQMC